VSRSGTSSTRPTSRIAAFEEPQLRELCIHRSAYQLKEADPHSWALPRLHGGPKAALVQIQADEYGNGDPQRIHAKLFRRLPAGEPRYHLVDMRSTCGTYLNGEAIPVPDDLGGAWPRAVDDQSRDPTQRWTGGLSSQPCGPGSVGSRPAPAGL